MQKKKSHVTTIGGSAYICGIVLRQSCKGFGGFRTEANRVYVSPLEKPIYNGHGVRNIVVFRQSLPANVTRN